MRSMWRQWRRYPIVESGDALYQSGLWPLALTVFFLIFFIAQFIAYPYLEAWQRPLMTGLAGGCIAWLFQTISPGPYRFGQFGQMLVQIKQNTLTLALADIQLQPPEVQGWPKQIEVALPTLAALTVKYPASPKWWQRLWRWHAQTTGICLELTGGTAKNVAMLYYHSKVNAAIIDFLQRKLPASVKITVDGKYLDRGGL